LARFPSLLVAYSGGVDSAFLLYAAHGVLGDKCTGVIADSPSLPRRELRDALDLAARIGACVEVVPTAEFDDPNYTANPVNRCFYCKNSLFRTMQRIAQESGAAALAYGENADDNPSERAGSEAASLCGVLSPLREAGLTKAEIRDACRAAGLPVAEKPASPCLSSRIPQGIPVTAEALHRIEQGEQILLDEGFRIFRLRHHGQIARLEFAKEELPRFHEPSLRQRVESSLAELGYATVILSDYPYGHPANKNNTLLPVKNI